VGVMPEQPSPEPVLPERVLSGRPTLEARGLEIARGGRVVVRGASFALSGGEMVALLGRNGAGKTSLLRALLGLGPVQGGTVLLGGQALPALSRRAIARSMAYVPQAHRLPFACRVEDVVALGRIAGNGLFSAGTRTSARERADAHVALERLHVGHLAPRDFTALSGGERQAVLLARALAQGARILVLDEPETGLDWGQQQRLAALLQDLAAEGYLVLATTHDPIRARGAFSRALLLRDGGVWADGPADAVLGDAAIAALYGVGG